MSRMSDVTLKSGEVTNPAAIAALVFPSSDDDTATQAATKSEQRHALGKRIRGVARGSVAYRDVSKDRGKSHTYDRDTANAIAQALNLPIRFVAGRAKAKAKQK